MTTAINNNSVSNPYAGLNSTTNNPGTLGQKDFLRLMTAQMQVQDPFDPVDNKEMLAQMAQFSSLAGLSEINDTLKLINTKLNVVLEQQAAAEAETPATTPASGTTTPATGTTTPTTAA